MIKYFEYCLKIERCLVTSAFSCRWCGLNGRIGKHRTPVTRTLATTPATQWLDHSIGHGAEFGVRGASMCTWQ